MTPEQTFGQLLGLGKSWKVVESRFEPESSTFFLKVEETPELWPEESARAGTPVVCHDHVEPMQWRHLNVFNKECVIVCALPRGRRGDDSKVYRVTPPWEGRSKHFTQEFEAFALTLMREMPVKRAGDTSVAASFSRLEGSTHAVHDGSEMSDPIFPRSPRESMSGWLYLPRFVDKIRLSLAGLLPSDYQANFAQRGFDAQWLKAAGLEADVFIEVVRGSITDGQVADWVRKNVQRPAEQAAFNQWLVQHGTEEDPDLRARLAMRKEQSGLAHRNDLTTFVDYIDADEKRI
jgi:hypothetical protein